jgi:hypothetical protein
VCPQDWGRETGLSEIEVAGIGGARRDSHSVNLNGN